MAQPQPQLELVSAPPADAPPDLMAHTRDRMAEVAADSAKNMAWRATVRKIKQYLPKVLWPLIPGEGGSVEGNVKAAASKWMWGAVTSAIISLVFFAVFALAFVGFALVTLYAVFS